MTNLSTELARLAEAATSGEWEIYPQSIAASTPERTRDNAVAELTLQIDQTPEMGDILYLLAAGDKCPATTGCGPTSEGNAALIVALRNNLPTIIAALKTAETPESDAGTYGDPSPGGLEAYRNRRSSPASGTAETPLGDVAGLVERLRVWKHSEFGKSAPGYMFTEAADAITALTRQLGEAQQHAEALAGGMDRAITFIEALADNDLDEPIADNGMTVGAKLQTDAPPLIFKLRAALAAYRSVAGRALERGEG